MAVLAKVRFVVLMRRGVICMKGQDGNGRQGTRPQFTNSRHFSSTVQPKQRHGQRQENLYLMGSPGSGKTTVGQILSSIMDRPVLDIDNDHLENHWNMPVSQKLIDVGGDRFVEEEGKATLAFEACGHVVSLTGSNPMYQPAMDHLKKSGIMMFLDVKDEDIIERLEKMKVNRIVGQGDGVSIADILKYRQQFYESNYDVRVICEPREAPESVAKKVQAAYQKYSQMTTYESTRGGESGQVQLPEVILKGQPDDGGLYVPSGSFPDLTAKQWERLVPLSYPKRASRILEQLVHPKSFRASTLADMVESAYTPQHFGSSDIFPIVKLAPNQYVQELFHGPTASFKDSALQFMPRMFQEAMRDMKNKARYLVLVATSGDTGGAVLEGFSRLSEDSGVSVMVLFPEKGISSIQKAQMTSPVGINVHVVGINSDFDFCQSFIKQVFSDRKLKDDIAQRTGFLLSSANSINWGRLMPQIVHHASAYLDLVKEGVISMGGDADLCIPTGNFGNILAAWYSKKMGIPWRRLICASNMNNVLTDFINTGVYDLTSRHLHLTSSPAIDILKSSNVERYLYHLTKGNAIQVAHWYDELKTKGTFTVGKDVLSKMQDELQADWCNEMDCFKTINKTWKDTGYLLDPHTAVAKTVADRKQDPETPMIISSTAHYAKFANDVLEATSPKRRGENLNHEEAFTMLEKMEPTPPMHTALRNSVLNKPRVHNTVVDAEPKAILNEIELFLKRQC